MRDKLTSFHIASSLMSLPALSCHCQPFHVIASEARQSQESKSQKSKGKMTEQK
jgi:hypothetical protein